MKKLTIGILTCNDFDGLYFSLQSIRLYHPEILDEVEFLVLDNDPESPNGQSSGRFVKGWIGQTNYIPVTDMKGTALRNRIFTYAKTPYVLSMDSHVLLTPGSLRKLIDFYDSENDRGWLLQGPLLYDDCRSISTHFELIWRAGMWGVWGNDDRGTDPNSPPFEIPAQGLGVFSCRKDSWLGFNPGFTGFGGEEGYIHTKYKQAGRGTLCLPFLRWMHRFERPNGVRYPLNIKDRIINYMIGFNELGLDTAPVREHFNNMIPQDQWINIESTVESKDVTTISPIDSLVKSSS